ncbi:MAG: YdjY domain-containing protein, partial [Verrucomicrobiales bacterium]|nr:YdjY domain-containing protein [Verrucomicrobiales bacterium]
MLVRLLGALGMIGSCTAAPYPLHLHTNTAPLSATVTNPGPREIEPGVFQLGGVRLDQVKRTIEFSGAVNMTQGPVEYLVVHQTGKVHESVLRTMVEPFHVHLAALLLQRKTPSINTNTGLAAREIVGPGAQIVIRYESPDGAKVLIGEELIFNLRRKSAMTSGPWTYNGSRVIEGTFLAQRDGSIASVITDPDALLNSLRPGRDNDDIWQVNTNCVPPVNTPV